MPRECAYCPAAAAKKCASCGKAYYCSQKCQRADWKHHIFNCDPPREINTAYRLCRAVFKNQLPEDEETQADYGFSRTTDARESQKLLGLYIGLFLYSNVDPRDVHRWRKNGNLLQEIRRIYDAKPPSSRGGYYPWILENQHILDPNTNSTFNPLEFQLKKTWAYIGGDPNPPYPDQDRIIESWSEKRRQVWVLYYNILAGYHPPPDQMVWVEFGFCICRSELEESSLAMFYTDIIISKGCPFDEFVAVHTNSSIPSLFPKYAADSEWANNQRLRQLLEESPIKSVWRLKAYVYQTIEQHEMLVSFRMDYGIINCRGVVALLQLLKDTYKRVFEHQDGDPDKLHEEAMQGTTFDYVDGLLKLKKKDRAVLRRLMKNRHST
jgi:hypothetical protein